MTKNPVMVTVGTSSSAVVRVASEKPPMVLFPSYLWHGTTPVRSDGRRLTIAFDAVPRSAGEAAQTHPAAGSESPLP